MYVLRMYTDAAVLMYDVDCLFLCIAVRSALTDYNSRNPPQVACTTWWRCLLSDHDREDAERAVSAGGGMPR